MRTKISFISFFVVCVLSDINNEVNKQTEMIPSARTYSEVPVETCGRRKIFHTELIVNGANTNPGDWPWHAAIYQVNRDTARYTCGGTLLSKIIVLTAAHCVTIQDAPILPEILNVILGKYNLFGGDLEAQEKMVHEVIVHELFVRKELTHDLALLKLASQVKFGDYVQPVCLWYPAALEKLPNIEIKGTVVGWGFDQTNSLAKQLKEASMPVQSEITCIRSNPTFYSKFLNNYTFCAGWNNGTSACNGDSGGGFHVYVPDLSGNDDLNASGAWYLFGIVSLSLSQPNIKICDPTKFVVYTKISEYREWILKKGNLDARATGTEVSDTSIFNKHKNSCGRGKIYPVENGNLSDAKPGEWSWHAAIYRKDIRHSISYICGGTLLSKTFILTAAQCVVAKEKPISPEWLTVILGKFKLDVAELENQERKIAKVIVHEFFQKSTLSNDIALLKMESEVVYGYYVQPACLSYPGVSNRLPNKIIKGTMVGWGYYIDALLPQLRQATLPLQLEDTCIQSSPGYYSRLFDQNKFCAGIENETLPLRGYAGGGFHVFVPDMISDSFAMESGTWYIYGITSFCPPKEDQIACDQFVTFTNISKYIDWISKHLH